ncbi:MAG: alpha/beta hydrolase [Chloroflexi bacterium]|nr:alpha/beta hydrolase [Chloroflexota bacterium]
MHTSRFQLPGGDRNVGTVYLPEEVAAPMPVLVVCFGGSSDRQPYPFTAGLCARLTAAGAGVVTFDVFGWGETGGDPNGWTYGRYAANLADVCTYVRDQAWADGDRIGALGISAGSTAVLRCAIETRSLTAGICVATFLGHYVSMPAGPARLLVDHLDTLLTGGTVEARGRGSVVYRFGLDHFIDAIGGAPIYRLHKVSCPILFLQGGADNLFRRSDARLGYELLQSHGLPASYREIEGGDHILSNVAGEGAEAVLLWLRGIGFLHDRTHEPEGRG